MKSLIITLMVMSFTHCKQATLVENPQPIISQNVISFSDANFKTSSGGAPPAPCSNNKEVRNINQIVNIEILSKLEFTGSNIVFDSIWIAKSIESQEVLSTTDSNKISFITLNLSKSEANVFKLTQEKKDNTVTLKSQFIYDYCNNIIPKSTNLPINPNEIASGVISYYKDGVKTYVVFKDMKMQSVALH